MSFSAKRKAPPSTDSNKKAKANGNANIMSFFGAPKPSTTSTTTTTTKGSSAPTETAPPLKFDKGKWVAGLKPEQKELLQLEIDTLDDSWLAHLKDELVTKEFLELKRFLNREWNGTKKIFPPKEDIYSWSRHTPFHTVKVVIVGQDPYHNVNQAHGLAFSVRPPTPAPPSLRNMYIALQRDYPLFVRPANNRGLLTPWADRGVLLLNTCLTVRAHEANSHANRGWERFTQRVLDLVAQKRTRGVAFMAWGTPAGKRVVRIDRARHLVLTAVHPSPLSASRGFFDCGHFRKANEWLVTRYGEGAEVDWDLEEKKKKPEPESESEPESEPEPEPEPEPAPAAPPKKPEEVKKEEEEVVVKPKVLEDEPDEDEEEMMRATLEAEEAEKKKKADAVNGDEKKLEDEEKEPEVPPAVVVVGEVEEKKDGSGGVQEKSEVLEKEGEDATETVEGEEATEPAEGEEDTEKE